MTKIAINVAEAFSRFPFGRYPEHGDDNGQRFREEFLIPALDDGNEVCVDLTGARGLAASFLEEAFGGLIREGYDIADIKARLTVKSDTDSSLVDEVWAYVADAAEEAATL